MGVQSSVEPGAAEVIWCDPDEAYHVSVQTSVVQGHGTVRQTFGADEVAVEVMGLAYVTRVVGVV